MKRHFAIALVAIAATLGATHAQAQFSSASGPVTPPLGSETNPYTPWASTQLANGEKQYLIAPAVSGYWYAAPLQHSALGSTLTHSGFQVSLSPSFTNAPLSFTSIQIGSFQGDALSVSANGSVITDNFASGSVLNFAANVHSFEVYSRSGSLPVTSSNTLFPLLLKFTGSASDMTWTSISSVPETETYVLMLLGLAVLGGTFGRRKSKA